MFVNIILALCMSFAVVKCGKSHKKNVTTKIVGGEKYEINKVPYMVSIKSKTKDNLCVCGGSIVNLLWVLTAGHCISEHGKMHTPETFRVLVGSTKCYDIIDENSQSIDITKLYLHERYDADDEKNPAHVYNDIGLILLAKEIKFGSKVQPVSLLTTDILKGKKPHQFFTKNCVASGWGLLELWEKPAPNLYGVELSLMDIDKCESYYLSSTRKFLFNKSMAICTMEPKGGKDVCSGDSGGPLVCNGYQIGVVSMGYGCAFPGVPNIWTRVDKYNEWINRTIGSVKPEEKKLVSKGDISMIVVYKLLIIAILEKCFLF